MPKTFRGVLRSSRVGVVEGEDLYDVNIEEEMTVIIYDFGVEPLTKQR